MCAKNEHLIKTKIKIRSNHAANIRIKMVQKCPNRRINKFALKLAKRNVQK